MSNDRQFNEFILNDLRERRKHNEIEIVSHRSAIREIALRIIAGAVTERDYRNLQWRVEKYIFFVADDEVTRTRIEELEMLLAPPLDTEKGERSVAI